MTWQEIDKLPTLFVFYGTPVKVRPVFWLMVGGLWALLSWLGSWRWSGQSLAMYLLAGGAATILALLADVGHACAHTVGARWAKAPMDVILLGSDMPRTLYANNDVPPRAHIMRSLGGPIYSAAGLLSGLFWLATVEPATAGRYLAEVWAVTNGFIFLALFAPLPIVDGGVILKWLLVLAGRSEARADQVVYRAGLLVAVLLLAAGSWLLIQTAWLLAGVMIMVGLVVVAVAQGIIT